MSENTPLLSVSQPSGLGPGATSSVSNLLYSASSVYMKMAMGFMGLVIVVLIIAVFYLSSRILFTGCEIYTSNINGKCERVDVNMAIQQFQKMVMDPKVPNQAKLSAAGFLVGRYPDFIENAFNGKLDGLNEETLKMLEDAKNMMPPMAPTFGQPVLVSNSGMSGVPEFEYPKTVPQFDIAIPEPVPERMCC